MDAVIRAAVVYFVLLVLFRLAGKRSLAQTTTFDFVLLLIIAEAIQNAMTGDNYSLTNAFLIVLTLIGIDIGLSYLKRWKLADKILDDVPLILVDHGRLFQDRMKLARVEESDILDAARQTHGLERMDQIKYAVLERAGGISIVPTERGGGASKEHSNRRAL